MTTELTIDRTQFLALIVAEANSEGQPLNELIARKLLKTVVVNARVKVTRAEVERLAATGFNVTQPTPVAPRQPSRSKGALADSPSKEILRIRL